MCKDIKPIVNNNNILLKKGSFCLIYSNVLNIWCKGQIISIFNDIEGEWLKIKYFDTNEHKICDIQRYSKQLKIFSKRLLYQSIIDIPTPPKPWKEIQSNNEILPLKLSNIIRLNENEFIVSGYTHDHDDEWSSADDMNGIYKYNILNGFWELFIEYPSYFFSQYHNICVDYKNEIIYIFNGGGSIIWKVYMNTKKFECIGLGNVQCFGGMGYIINNKFNVFYGNNNGNHLILDQYTLKMDIIYKFNEYKKGLLSFGMVYNKYEKYFLFFGGYKGKDLGRTNEIWKYSIKNNENIWCKLDINMPDKMQSFGSVITQNAKYVIIIGGQNSNGISDKIYILNLLNMKWSQSKIICPFKGIGYGNVINVRDNKNNECIHIVQGMYSHIKIALADILEN
eukprot:442444_1